MKSDSNFVWVGIILRFWDDEIDDEKKADFLWFVGENELHATVKAKKRTDFLPVSTMQRL